jgi:hypothetical protein
VLLERLVPSCCDGDRNYHYCYSTTQALTYLRLMNLKLALVINFGKRLVKDGIHRVVNKL